MVLSVGKSFLLRFPSCRFFRTCRKNSETYLGYYSSSTMEPFAKVVDGSELLAIFVKSFIADTQQGP